MSSEKGNRSISGSAEFETGRGRGGEEAGEDSTLCGPTAGEKVDGDQVSREKPRPGAELASYRISSGERILVCVEGERGLDIHDVPADFLGESYRVERALNPDHALWAVVDDYLAQAKRLDAPPMSEEALATVFRRVD